MVLLYILYTLPLLFVFIIVINITMTFMNTAISASIIIWCMRDEKPKIKSILKKKKVHKNG